ANIGFGQGGGQSVLGFEDIDGDGKLDHVVKNNKVTFFDGPYPTLFARLNQTGKSNLLKTVTRPFGATISLDYERQLNAGGTFTTLAGGTERVELPEGRWTLSKVTVDDHRAPPIADTISYSIGTTAGTVTSGFFDRNEKEFYGYARVTVLHGRL